MLRRRWQVRRQRYILYFASISKLGTQYSLTQRLPYCRHLSFMKWARPAALISNIKRRQYLPRRSREVDEARLWTYPYPRGYMMGWNPNTSPLLPYVFPNGLGSFNLRTQTRQEEWRNEYLRYTCLLEALWPLAALADARI